MPAPSAVARAGLSVTRATCREIAVGLCPTHDGDVVFSARSDALSVLLRHCPEKAIRAAIKELCETSNAFSPADAEDKDKLEFDRGTFYRHPVHGVRWSHENPIHAAAVLASFLDG